MFYVYPRQLQRSMDAREYGGLKEEDKTGRQEGTRQGNHFSEVSGIREYTPGDSMRDIHWKLSAKKEKLMAKEHVILSDTNQTLLVELADVLYEQERCIEDVLELLMNFLQEYVTGGIPFEIVWWNQKQEFTEHLTVNRTEQIFSSLEHLMEAGMYKDNFLLEQRTLLDKGDISQWKWRLVRRSCELLKQCAAMDSIDLPALRPWDPIWNRPEQIIQHDTPTTKQFSDPENIYVLVWMVNKHMKQLGLSESTVRHYTEEGLAVILKKHYDSGTECYSDKLISQLTEERRLQYEQGVVGRTAYQHLRKAAAMLQEFHQTGKITLDRIPDWGRRRVIPQHKAILDKFRTHVTTQRNWAESSVSTVTSVAHVFLLGLEDYGVNVIQFTAFSLS